MTSNAASRRRPLGSGWICFVVVVLAFVGMVHRAAEVDYRDIVVFLAYLAGWIVLPGTLAWRFVDPRRERRPLGEDLAVGALVGYVLELPVYLICLGLGHPHGYLLWPLVPLVLLCTPAARRVRHLGTGRLPWQWSWSVAIAALYVVAWFGRYVWSAGPDQDTAMRQAYVDEPYHLALATGLRHFYPPRITYVADTPLDYHFASHVHIAASSWVTGVEPSILLRSLAIPALVVIVLMAAAFIAVRLTGAAWTGPALLVTLLLLPTSYAGWSNAGGEGLLSHRLVSSPSAGFVNAALLLGLLLCVELLRSRRRPWHEPGAYALALLVFVAMSGAKSTSLPTVIAGLALAAVVSSLLNRRLDLSATVLTVGALVGFQVSRWIFFGPGSRGLAVDPLSLPVAQGSLYPGLLDADGRMPFGTRLVVATFMIGYLTLGAAALGLLARKGWRKPENVFLVTICAAGIGAGLMFHQENYGEYYFVYVVALPLMLAAALGVHHLAQGRPGRRVASLGTVALIVGALGALFVGSLLHPTSARTLTGSPLAQAVHLYALPAALALGAPVLLAAAVLLGRRLLHRDAPPVRGLALLVVVVTVAGFGAGPVLRNTLPKLLSDPLPGPAAAPSESLIGPGGIQAARWLRAHSAVDTTVATNAHCQVPNTGVCVPRNFWMAGYAERQFLVEGWSYVSRSSIGQHAPADENVTVGPFWDAARLSLNDKAFRRPTAANLGRLRTEYGVRWLFVDLRYQVDLPALAREADLRFSSGAYRVFELR